MLSNRVEVVLSGSLYLAVGTQSPIICSPQLLYFSPLLSGYPFLDPTACLFCPLPVMNGQLIREQ